MRDWLLTLVIGSGGLGLLLTAVLRSFPKSFANKAGQSVNRRGIYPDIDHGYLSRTGRLISSVRYLAFFVFVLGLILGAVFE